MRYMKRFQKYILVLFLLIVPRMVFASTGNDDFPIYLALLVEAFVTIHMSLFVILPISGLVSKDNNNKLTATAKYEGKTSLTVTNTFEPAVTKEPIKVTKDFKDWGKADEFEFTLAAVTDGAPMPEGAANGELKKNPSSACKLPKVQR